MGGSRGERRKGGVGFGSLVALEDKAVEACRKSIEVAQSVMKQLSASIEGFEPFLRFSGFAKPGITFTIVIRGRDIVDQHLLRHELVKQLHDRYRTEGIQIV